VLATVLKRQAENGIVLIEVGGAYSIESMFIHD